MRGVLGLALGLAAFALLGVVAATASASAGIIVRGLPWTASPWIVMGTPHSPSVSRVVVFVALALAVGLGVLRPRESLPWLVAVGLGFFVLAVIVGGLWGILQMTCGPKC